jgi:hypothetical protein
MTIPMAYSHTRLRPSHFSEYRGMTGNVRYQGKLHICHNKEYHRRLLIELNPPDFT